jgi:hypothetical protein
MIIFARTRSKDTNAVNSMRKVFSQQRHARWIGAGNLECAAVPQIMPYTCRYCAHEVIGLISELLTSRLEMRQKVGDDTRYLVALPGIEPGFED